MATEAKNQEYPNYIGKTNNIKTELENLKKSYGAKYVELYKREYEYVDKYDYKNHNLSSMTLMNFNILADGLSGVHVDENAKDAESQKKTFIGVPKDCLLFNYRGFRILEEITRNDPDIICMQECDQFDFFLHYLKPLGFNGVFNPKSSSPCTKIAKANNIKLNADGVCIIYKEKKYKIKSIRKFGKTIENIQNVDVPAIAIVFNDIKKNKDFIVAVAHLKSTKNIKGEIIRLNQLQHLLPNIKTLSSDNNDIPVFFACDLNTNNNETYSTVYDSIMFPSKVSSTDNDKDKDKDKPKMPKEYISGYNSLNLYSSYYDFAIPNTSKKEKEEPVFTTYKKRADGVMKHTIDYIFYQKAKAKCVGLLSIPNEQDINKATLLPGYEYPSDHFAIMAGFQF